MLCMPSTEGMVFGAEKERTGVRLEAVLFYDCGGRES